MSETKESGDTKLTLSSGKTLQLKKSVDAGSGQMRQSVTQGRGKAVVVERKRRRVITRDGEHGHDDLGGDSGDGHLSQGEKAVRLRALEEARKQEALEKQRQEEEAKRRAEEEARLKAEEETRRRLAAEEAVRQAKEDALKLQDESASGEQPDPSGLMAAPAVTVAKPKPRVEPAAAPPPAAKARAPEVAAPPPPEEARRPKPEDRVKTATLIDEEEEDERKKRARAGAGAAKVQHAKPTPKVDSRRANSKLTVQRALDDGVEERQRSMAAMRRAREKQKAMRRSPDAPQKLFREVIVPENITVAELANRMTERANDVVRELMKIGVLVSANDTIDADTAEIIVAEMGHKMKRVAEADVEAGLVGAADNPEDLRPRPPVVTIMGHVDHGKTSLLDALRATDVVSGESGGITQHIGAYQVTMPGGEKITFLDTPGHSAFTAMRARGAQVTDIVVLVVAADDGIMPQTVEAIQHARAAGVPIIVAINKIDKYDANPDKIRQALLQYEIVVESLGGDTLDIEVSAKERTNLDKLEEAIILQAEVLELAANPSRPAEGAVIEATLDKGRGAVATVLVTRGTLRIGDIFVMGAESGRVRALIDDKGNNLKEAGPSLPVAVLGASGGPMSGDDFLVVESEARAREISVYRQRQLKERLAGPSERISLEAMLDKLKTKEVQELPVVIKADVHGSAEAVSNSLTAMNTDEVAVKILLSGVGGVSESDVALAEASKAPILAFNVRAAGKARTMAEQTGVEIRYYSVIYDLVDDIKSALSGMLSPEIRETIIGLAEVKEVFNAGKGKAAGCIVVEGSARSGVRARVLRDDVVVHDGKVSSLRRFRDEVKDVAAGTECGITIENFNDVKAGDRIEMFSVEERARTL
ncbi:translation initiation factor IF-2 [Emcibacter sp. SYSU 3D8]|uniref:translation initiation factor IF-2 n=1 Tax=Emcibacter sp. SYSU 3D8 TaxID=3133969 RepID=UPI0031FEB9BF